MPPNFSSDFFLPRAALALAILCSLPIVAGAQNTASPGVSPTPKLSIPAPARPETDPNPAAARREARRLLGLARSALLDVPVGESRKAVAIWFATAFTRAGDAATAIALTQAEAATLEKNEAGSIGWFRILSLADISQNQARMGDATGALATAAFFKDEKGDYQDMAVGEYIKALARSGDIAGAQAAAAAAHPALAAAAAAKNYGYDAFNLQTFIATGQAEAGDFLGARETTDALPEAILRTGPLGSIVTELASRGDVVGARQTLEHIDRVGRYSHHYDMRSPMLADIARAQFRAGDFAGAEESIREMEPGPVKMSTLSELVEARARAGDPAGVKQDLAEMESLFGKFGETDEFTRIEAICKIAWADAKAGDADGSRQRYEEAAAVAKTMKDDDGQKTRAESEIDSSRSSISAVVPDETEVAKITDPLKRARGFGMLADSLLETLPKPDDNNLPLAPVPSPAPGPQASSPQPARSSRANAAAAYHPAFSPNVPTPLIPPPPAPVRAPAPGAPSAEIARLDALRHLFYAQVTAMDIDDPFHSAPAWSEIGALRGKTGDPEGGKQCLRFAADLAGETSVYRGREMAGAAVAQLEAGDPTAAKVTIDRVRFEPDKSEALQTLAEAQAKAGDLAGAIETGRTVTEIGFQTRTWSSIALILAKAGDKTSALQTLEWAKLLYPYLTDNVARHNETVHIERALAWVGDVEGVMVWLQGITNKDHLDFTQNDALETFLERKNAAGTALVARMMNGPARWENPWQLVEVARALAHANDPERARQWLQQALEDTRAMVDRDSRDRGLYRVSSLRAELGDIKDAREISNGIGNDRTRGEALRAVANAQKKAGDTGAAQATNEEAELLTKHVPFEEGDNYFRSLVRERIQGGDLAGATAAAAAILKADPDDSVWCELGRATAQRDNSAMWKSSVTAIAADRSDMYSQIRNYRAIARQQAKLEGFAAAEGWLRTVAEPASQANGYIALARLALGLKDSNSDNYSCEDDDN